ncbi:MAG: DUF488 domain-containing protein [Marmoricola sp.]
MPAPLLTFGHGRLRAEELSEIVGTAGIERVVDVRRFPGSRANEAAARGVVPTILDGIGVDYRWDERLGGRRHQRKDEPSPDTWWEVAAFRAYAAWTRTPDFAAGLADLLADAAQVRTAVMCSESVWWRCHRRIISDVVVLAHDTAVEHLMHTGVLVPHRPSEGARLLHGELVWDRP